MSRVWFRSTFVTTANGIEIDVVHGEENAQPRTKAIDGNDKQNSHHPELLLGYSVISEMLENLARRDQTGHGSVKRLPERR